MANVTSSDSSRGLIQRFVDTMDLYLSSGPALAFCRSAESVPASEFAKTWIGVNFDDTTFVSIKLYLTVYELLPLEVLSRLVGNPLVAENCLQLMSESHACLDPRMMGSGYTICFKLSHTSGGAFGFHVRHGNHGVFRHFTQQGWFDKSYFYVSDPEQLEALSEKISMPSLRNYSELEVGTGHSHGQLTMDAGIKVVPQGNFSDLSCHLFTQVEQEVVLTVQKRFRLTPVAGGIHFPQKLKSVYFVECNRIRTFSAFI
ncbi:hypothetical protein BH11PLA2_BH11PLA2_22530 [soil metagenome]